MIFFFAYVTKSMILLKSGTKTMVPFFLWIDFCQSLSLFMEVGMEIKCFESII